MCSNGQTETARLTIINTGGNHFRNSNSDEVLSRTQKTSTVQLPMVGDISLYPNPSSGEFNLDFRLQTEQNLTVELIGINGKKHAVLIEGKRASGYHHLKKDFSSLNSGIYTLLFNTSEEIITKIIVIQ